VPCLFLYREPVETIVSNLQNVPPWLVDEDRRVLASMIGSSSEAISEMSLEELCARAIGSFYSTANRVANSRTLLLNYNQLSLAEITNVLQFFGVGPAAAEMESIAHLSQKYSKADRAFVADAEAKQQIATDLIRDMAQTWAVTPYRLLEQKRLEHKRS